MHDIICWDLINTRTHAEQETNKNIKKSSRTTGYHQETNNNIKQQTRTTRNHHEQQETNTNSKHPTRTARKSPRTTPRNKQ